MPKIDQMSQLLSTLRKELSGKVDRGTASKTGTFSGLGESSQAQLAPTTLEDLKRRITVSLKSLDLKSAVGQRQARKAFVESVLMWDFGDQVIRDARFGDIVRQVEETFGADDTLAEDLNKILRDLQQR